MKLKYFLFLLIPLNAFSQDWVLLNNDFECTNDKNKSCYFNLYDRTYIRNYYI